MSKMNNFELAAKINWEGGVFAALEYGIVSEDIESETIASLWAELEGLYKKMAPLVLQIEETLEAE